MGAGKYAGKFETESGLMSLPMEEKCLLMQSAISAEFSGSMSCGGEMLGCCLFFVVIMRICRYHCAGLDFLSL